MIPFIGGVSVPGDDRRRAGGLRLPARLAGHAGLWLIALLFAGIVAAYRDFIPYWDARTYFSCVAEAAQKPFQLLNFRCAGHPSIVYLFLLGLTQYLFPWNVPLAYAVNALLGIASIGAFHALLRLLFPDRPASEYALVTSLYAFAPLFLAHAIFFNLDYGMTAFFVLFLYFLVARRFWIASVLAIAMMFSKETGTAAYALTVLAYAIAFALRQPQSWRERVVELRAQVPLMAAPLALAAYVLFFQLTRPDSGPWSDAYVQYRVIPNRLELLLNTNLADASIRSYLADIFVLNYQWLYTAVIVAALCAAVTRSAHDVEARVALPGSGLFFALLISGLVYTVTRYRDYNNARYVLIVSPVLIVVFYRALLSVATNGTARRIVLGAIAALVLLSNFRTLDFGSKYVFGTFRFGSHALLDMPSLIGGLRQDAIVYNLESLQFHYVLSDILQDLRPAAGTVFFTGDTTYFFPPPVDARSYALTLDQTHALPLNILSADGDTNPETLRRRLRDGDRFFYLAFANANNHQLTLLQARYPLIGMKQYERNGYTADVYSFRFTPLP